MSHTPEQPEQYVCVGCQAVFAGKVYRTDDGHRFAAPDDCAACGGTDFVESSQWVYGAAQEPPEEFEA